MKQLLWNRLVRKVRNFYHPSPWTIETFPVRVVITGMEHSGTTILSTLLKQHPRIDCGFECGFLLADSPACFPDVHPWYEWMLEPESEGHWGLSAEQMRSICSAESWSDAYQRLIRFSPVFEPGEGRQVCDKTPRYLKYLDKVLDKLPECVPCLVIEKEIESLWHSHKRRYGHLGNFIRDFEMYHEGLRRGMDRHGHRIHRVSYEALCLDLETELRRIFTVLDLDLAPEFVSRNAGKLKAYHDRIWSRQAKSIPSEEDEQLWRLRKRFSDLLPPGSGID